ncbi:E3 ubiquitin-protein ligase rnf168 [Denticeps clupeoides]|uniref:RING-type E3 ubiquitin transferase n=1 Tax=Denticeps clupeoides TaxID=299321 RepID=A0AAY4C2J4_9TELE|nr:E3 ubiquitin-protein ligase rnf168-like [Denticeps clupeoides]
MAPVSEVDVGLSHADCLCPVCLEIFLEPVTLPCSHSFCKSCFSETVDKANICCPLCRRRVSTWARVNGRNKTLVNAALWQRVQQAFPAQCQRRLSGLDDDGVSVRVSKPRVSEPGEVRKEYEEQISKHVEERRALEEAEQKASEEYIQRLLAEEEERLGEERKRQAEKQLEDDARLARLLSQELNSSPVLEAHRSGKPADNSLEKKKKPVAGDIERFLSPRGLSSSSHTSSANKENLRSQSADSEPMSSSSLASEVREVTVVDDEEGTSSTSAKRKSWQLEASEAGTPKRPRTPLARNGGDLLLDFALQEEESMSHMRQEKLDYQIALRLQRQMDREEHLLATDRSKGSTNPYLLRQKCAAPRQGPSAESPTTSQTPRPHHNSAQNQERRGKVGQQQPSTEEHREQKTRNSSKAPATPLKGGAKQTTLTDMFPSLSN